MYGKVTLACVLIGLMLGGTAFATSGIPDLSNSVVTWAYEGEGNLSLMNLPNGQGFALDQAVALGTGDGSAMTRVDATINLTMLDGANFAIANFPFEDMWLQSADGGMVACTGGTVADVNTDIQGNTYWRYPLQAGGWSTGLVDVMINGEAVIGTELRLQMNSPDLTGDLTVNLSDVATFASDYFTAYHYRGDFNFDGALNLPDVAFMAAALGVTCP